MIKQLKGAGVHKLGAKAHNLYPANTLDAEHMVDGLKRRALAPEAWAIVRDNFVRAGGGLLATWSRHRRRFHVPSSLALFEPGALS